MANPNQGKASKAMEELLSRPLSPEAIAARGPKIPALKLKADAPAISASEATSVAHVLSGLAAEQTGALVVRTPDGNPGAVVLSLDRYITLVGEELATTAKRVATLDGRLVPSEEAFAATHVEPVDPQESWAHGAPSQS